MAAQEMNYRLSNNQPTFFSLGNVGGNGNLDFRNSYRDPFMYGSIDSKTIKPNQAGMENAATGAAISKKALEIHTNPRANNKYLLQVPVADMRFKDASDYHSDVKQPAQQKYDPAKEQTPAVSDRERKKYSYGVGYGDEDDESNPKSGIGDSKKGIRRIKEKAIEYITRVSNVFKRIRDLYNKDEYISEVTDMDSKGNDVGYGQNDISYIVRDEPYLKLAGSYKDNSSDDSADEGELGGIDSRVNSVLATIGVERRNAA